MQEIIYDIHGKSPLIIGYAGEHNARKVSFTGFKKQEDISTVHLMIEGIGMIPLLDFCFDIEYEYTQNSGNYIGYLVEIKDDDSLIHKSNNFVVIVKNSAELEDIVVPETPSFTLWFNAMSELYQTVQTKLANGEFKGAKGDKGDTGNAGQDGVDGYSPTVTTSKTGKTTTITITDKNGTRTATVLDGNDGQNGRDGRDGTDASVTTQNIVAALGYEPADAQTVSEIDEHIATSVDPDIEGLKEELTAQANTKVGYSEVVNGQLLMYDNSDKEHLLATLDLPTTDLTDYVKNTDYATKTTGGVVKVSDSYGTVMSSSGAISADYISNTYYDGMSNSAFIGKGTLNKNFPNLLKKAISSETDPAWDTATQNKALTRLGAEPKKGEWVLKGTMTLENLLNCPVDFSGCSEFMIKGRTVGTAATNLNVFDNSSSVIGTVGSITTGTERFFYFRFADVVNNIEPIVARYGTESNNKISGNLNAYIMFDNSIKNIKYFKVGNSSIVTEMELSIYAR